MALFTAGTHHKDTHEISITFNHVALQPFTQTPCTMKPPVPLTQQGSDRQGLPDLLQFMYTPQSARSSPKAGSVTKNQDVLHSSDNRKVRESWSKKRNQAYAPLKSGGLRACVHFVLCGSRLEDFRSARA